MEPGQTTPPAELAAAKPLLGARISLLATIAAVWGPGLLVMLADTDAGNVVTAAQAGSVWGFRLAPVLLLLIPVLILVQDLAVRIGIYRNCGFGDLIRENFGRPGAYVAAAALIAATLGSLVTEFTGIAGVGELYGASRWIILPLASATLIVVAFTGAYRRVERIALVFGLFEVAFLFVAWRSHPAASEIVRDVADQKLNDTGYLYLVAGLIGATFNPWMIFYQASAISEKRLTLGQLWRRALGNGVRRHSHADFDDGGVGRGRGAQIGCNRPIARQYRPDQSSSDAAAGRNHWAPGVQRWRGRGGDGRGHRLFPRLRLGPG